MHQHMDTVANGLERISSTTAPQYGPGSTLHSQAPALPLRSSPSRPQAPSLREVPPPRPLPPAPHREVAPQREIITLDQVRTGPRPQNDYVDSPHWTTSTRGSQHHKTSTLPHPHHVGISKSLHVPTGMERLALYSPPSGGSSGTGGGGGTRDPVITSQPQPSHGLKKDALEEDSQPTAPCQESIICSHCGKCRCQACTQPRELPRRWLCNNKCECSLQKLVDVCSCLCCVRACFYHCFKDIEGDECSASDDPCACCERPHCCKRWACLGLMSVCLPCLCFYWPLRCGLSCCTSVYNKCSRRGCHCRRDKLPGSKRLLIDSESSST